MRQLNPHDSVESAGKASRLSASFALTASMSCFKEASTKSWQQGKFPGCWGQLSNSNHPHHHFSCCGRWFSHIYDLPDDTAIWREWSLYIVKQGTRLFLPITWCLFPSSMQTRRRAIVKLRTGLAHQLFGPCHGQFILLRLLLVPAVWLLLVFHPPPIIWFY